MALNVGHRGEQNIGRRSSPRLGWIASDPLTGTGEEMPARIMPSRPLRSRGSSFRSRACCMPGRLASMIAVCLSSWRSDGRHVAEPLVQPLVVVVGEPPSEPLMRRPAD